MSKFKLIATSLYFGLVAVISYSCFLNQITVCSSIFFISFASFMRFVFLPADCDMVLLFYEYFGKKVGHLTGKVIWITGASTGIGKEMAFAFSKAKLRLVLSARSEDKLDLVKKRCMEIGNLESKDVLVLPFDMTDTGKHDWAFSCVLKHFGQLDVLVSNAGRSQRGAWEKIEREVDEALFDVNVFSLVQLARIVTRHFMAADGGGRHVVMSSLAGKMGVASPSYTASKHALIGYFESLRAEQGAKGVGVTLLCPGPVESDLMSSVLRETRGEVGASPRVGDLMSGARCAELIAVAAANGVSEAWIALQPVLSILYLNQYQPALVKWCMNNIDFASVAAELRDGKKESASQ